MCDNVILIPPYPLPSFLHTNKQVCAPVIRGKRKVHGGEGGRLCNTVILIAFGAPCRHANEARTSLLSPLLHSFLSFRKQESACDHLQLQDDLCRATELIRSGHLDAALVGKLH